MAIYNDSEEEGFLGSSDTDILEEEEDPGCPQKQKMLEKKLKIKRAIYILDSIKVLGTVNYYRDL